MDIIYVKENNMMFETRYQNKQEYSNAQEFELSMTPLRGKETNFEAGRSSELQYYDSPSSGLRMGRRSFD